MDVLLEQGVVIIVIPVGNVACGLIKVPNGYSIFSANCDY